MRGVLVVIIAVESGNRDLRKTCILVSVSGASVQTIIDGHILITLDGEVREDRALISETNRASQVIPRAQVWTKLKIDGRSRRRVAGRLGRVVCPAFLLIYY